MNCFGGAETGLHSQTCQGKGCRMLPRDRRRPCRNPLAWTAWTCSTKATGEAGGLGSKRLEGSLGGLGRVPMDHQNRDASFQEKRTAAGGSPPKLSMIENIIFELYQAQSRRQLRVLSVQGSPFLPHSLPVPRGQLGWEAEGETKQSALLSTSAHYRLPARRRGKKNQTSIKFRFSMCMSN